MTGPDVGSHFVAGDRICLRHQEDSTGIVSRIVDTGDGRRYEITWDDGFVDPPGSPYDPDELDPPIAR